MTTQPVYPTYGAIQGSAAKDQLIELRNQLAANGEALANTETDRALGIVAPVAIIRAQAEVEARCSHDGHPYPGPTGSAVRRRDRASVIDQVNAARVKALSTVSELVKAAASLQRRLGEARDIAQSNRDIAARAISMSHERVEAVIEYANNEAEAAAVSRSRGVNSLPDQLQYAELRKLGVLSDHEHVSGRTWANMIARLEAACDPNDCQHLHESRALQTSLASLTSENAGLKATREQLGEAREQLAKWAHGDKVRSLRQAVNDLRRTNEAAVAELARMKWAEVTSEKRATAAEAETKRVRAALEAAEQIIASAPVEPVQANTDCRCIVSPVIMQGDIDLIGLAKQVLDDRSARMWNRAVTKDLARGYLAEREQRVCLAPTHTLPPLVANTEGMGGLAHGIVNPIAGRFDSRAAHTHIERLFDGSVPTGVHTVELSPEMIASGSVAFVIPAGTTRLRIRIGNPDQRIDVIVRKRGVAALPNHTGRDRLDELADSVRGTGASVEIEGVTIRDTAADADLAKQAKIGSGRTIERTLANLRRARQQNRTLRESHATAANIANIAARQIESLPGTKAALSVRVV